MWADNYGPLRDDNEKLVCKLNEIIEELLDLDMEPKRSRHGGRALFKKRMLRR